MNEINKNRPILNILNVIVDLPPIDFSKLVKILFTAQAYM
jgi:hypothetical protein